MTLRFSPRGHAYTLDGKRCPGVTTLLGKGLPKPAIPYWAARSVAEYVVDNPEKLPDLLAMGRGPAVAALKEVPWQRRDTAAVRGTDVHALAERVAHGVEVEVPEHLAGHVEGYAHWLEAFDVQPVVTETPVASRKWFYAGTFDAIVRFGRGPWAGRTALIDLKTSSGVYGETALQVAAYASADFMAPNPDDEQPIPDLDATGVVHITEHGATFYPLADGTNEIADAFKVFTHIQYVAKRTDWIKELVGPAMPEPESESAA